MNILLLEDDKSLHRAIVKILELEHHKVSSFYDGDEVIKLQSYNYDLYILDINVPYINGLELLKYIYDYNNQSKIIMISSNIDFDSIERAYRNGCIDYLKKPFQTRELLLKVGVYTRSRGNISKYIKLQKDKTLTKMEKKFLSLLIEYKGNIVSYQTIEDRVYETKEMKIDTLRSLVKRVRAKMEEDIIENVIDEGYLINCDRIS